MHVWSSCYYLCIDLGRFRCHFDAGLKDGNWKARVRGAAQPQAEIFVGSVNLGLENGGGGEGEREKGKESVCVRERERERERERGGRDMRNTNI